MQTPIPVGLAAYGMSGKVFHGPLLKAHAGFRVATIVERTADKSAADFPDAVRVRTFEALLRDPHIPLVVVNTPHAQHFALCRQALEAGKHVVVEKPVAVTAAEARLLAGLAAQRGLLLAVFHNRRWDGDFQTVRQVVQNGWLGRLVSFEAHYDRYRNYVEGGSWKEQTGPGSGTLYNLGPHLIDQALQLFGRPQAVTAHMEPQRPGGTVDDSFHVRLHYAGLGAVLRSSYLVREPGPRYILHGTEGSFLKWGIDPQEEALKAGRGPLEPGWGAEPESDWGLLNTQIGGLHAKARIETLPGNYLAFYDNLHQALTAGVALAVQPEEAAQVVEVIEAAYRSHTEKRTVAL